MHAHRRRTPLVIAAAVVVAVVVVALVWSTRTDDAAPGTAPTSAAPVTTTPTPRPSSTPAPSPALPGAPGTTAAPGPGSAPSAPVTEPPAQPVPALGPVEVVTTFAGWNDLSGAVEVGAYAATLEAPGTCTLVLTGPTGTVQRRQQGAADASTVSCGGFSVPRAELAAGAWQAHVEYASARSAGVSETVEVQVP
jgi:hypothetical protein